MPILITCQHVFSQSPTNLLESIWKIWNLLYILLVLYAGSCVSFVPIIPLNINIVHAIGPRSIPINMHIHSKLLQHMPVMGTHSSYQLDYLFSS